MGRIKKIGTLAAAGTTGNNTSPSVKIDDDTDIISAEFEITAAGATPTVTYKLQGSMDDTTVTDAASDWFDLLTFPNDSSTEAVTQTKTAVGVYQLICDLKKRFARKVRLVVTANTNVTYESDLYGMVDI